MPNLSLPTNRQTKAYLSGMPNRVALQITEKHRVKFHLPFPSHLRPSLGEIGNELSRKSWSSFTRCCLGDAPLRIFPSQEGKDLRTKANLIANMWGKKTVPEFTNWFPVRCNKHQPKRPCYQYMCPPCLANALYSGVSSKFSGKARRRTCGVRKEVKTCGSVPRAIKYLEDFRGMCWTSPSKKGTMINLCTPRQFFWTPFWPGNVCITFL